MNYKGYGITMVYKSLGITIQRNGLFNIQANHIINKIKQGDKLIKSLKIMNANQNFRIMVWYANVQSHIRYANLI